MSCDYYPKRGQLPNQHHSNLRNTKFQNWQILSNNGLEREIGLNGSKYGLHRRSNRTPSLSFLAPFVKNCEILSNTSKPNCQPNKTLLSSASSPITVTKSLSHPQRPPPLQCFESMGHLVLVLRSLTEGGVSTEEYIISSPVEDEPYCCISIDR